MTTKGTFILILLALISAGCYAPGTEAVKEAEAEVVRLEGRLAAEATRQALEVEKLEAEISQLRKAEEWQANKATIMGTERIKYIVLAGLGVLWLVGLGFVATTALNSFKGSIAKGVDTYIQARSELVTVRPRNGVMPIIVHNGFLAFPDLGAVYRLSEDREERHQLITALAQTRNVELITSRAKGMKNTENISEAFVAGPAGLPLVLKQLISGEEGHD